MDGKLTERVGIPMSAEMLGAIRAQAKKNKRKILDQIRYLIEKGLEAESGADVGSRMDVLEMEVHAMREQLASYVSPPKVPKKRAAS